MKRKYLVLLDADPADPTGGNPPAPATPPAKPAGAPPAKPASPAVVGKTPIKTPNEIRLEKEVAKLQDEIDRLGETQSSILETLEGLKIGGPAPVSVKPGKVAPPAPPAQSPAKWYEQVDKDIWGGN